MHILLIEDDPDISALLTRGLGGEGYKVTHAADGESGLAHARKPGWDAVVLDVMLPGLDGTEICRTLRMERNRTPILMLSALAATDDIVRRLRLGADDYMTKPFAFAELLARLETIARRGQEGEEETVLVAGPLVFDRDALEVKRDGVAVTLTSLEYALLEYLMVESGKVLTRAQILQNVWGSMEDPLTNIVDVYIRRLRTKIDGSGESFIETVRGRGYRFRSTEKVAAVGS